jgi:hypothetical protein
VDSDGNDISQPATAPPGQNGQQGQGVDSADGGPAVDQGRPGKPIKDCGGGTCVTLPNTVKRKFIDGETHYDFGFDFDASTPPDDGKASLGTGRGLVSVRLTIDQIKALDGARMVGMALSGVAGAARAALGRLYRGVASRASGALSSALGRLTGKLGTLSRAEKAARGADDAVTGFRAVSRAEADDIARHGFRPDPSGRSMESKWFSGSREGAEWFRNNMSGLDDVVEAACPGPCTNVATGTPTSMVRARDFALSAATFR